MKYRIEILSEQAEDFVILAKERTLLLERLEELLGGETREIFGTAGTDVVTLGVQDVYCFLVESGKVYALTEDGKWQVKERLYALEQRFSAEMVKINQSCLVNRHKILRFRTTFGGALQVVLKNGYTDYISRRQLKEVKERMGM